MFEIPGWCSERLHLVQTLALAMHWNAKVTGRDQACCNDKAAQTRYKLGPVMISLRKQARSHLIYRSPWPKSFIGQMWKPNSNQWMRRTSSMLVITRHRLKELDEGEQRGRLQKRSGETWSWTIFESLPAPKNNPGLSLPPGSNAVVQSLSDFFAGWSCHER